MRHPLSLGSNPPAVKLGDRGAVVLDDNIFKDIVIKSLRKAFLDLKYGKRLIGLLKRFTCIFKG